MLLDRAPLLLVLAALGALGATTIACSGGSDPQRQVEVVSPAGLKVNATISAVSLASYSSGSNLQISFMATDAQTPATIEITSVVLVDTTTGDQADVLKSSDPKVWNGSAYVAWNQKVTPGGDLKASYSLTTPNWSAIDGTQSNAMSSRSGSRSYSTPFRVRVTMRIDGTEVILDSRDLSREPEVAT